MSRRSSVRLMLAVAVTVASSLIAISTGRPEATLFGAPWAVLLLLGLSRTGERRVRASVSLVEDRVVVGDEVEVTTTVTSDAEGWVEIKPSPEAGFRPPNEERSRTKEKGVGEVVDVDRPVAISTMLQADEWGAHDLGRVEVTFHERFGLLEWSGVIHQPNHVRVHPTPGQIQQLVTPRLVRRLSGVHRSTGVERGIEYADVRPFASGDSLRDVNWRASARAEGIWVSQRHPERATDVILLLDSFVESGHDVRSVVGLAIEAAVMLAESHLAMTDRVGLVELGGVVRWVVPGVGRLQLQRLTDTLLATRFYDSASDRTIVAVGPRALPPRSFVVALSPLLDERFVNALHSLRGSGHDVAVIECVAEIAYDRAPSDVGRVARRLWDLERIVERERLIEHGVAVGTWHRGDPLDPVLAEIVRVRRGAGGSRR